MLVKVGQTSEGFITNLEFMSSNIEADRSKISSSDNKNKNEKLNEDQPFKVKEPFSLNAESHKALFKSSDNISSTYTYLFFFKRRTPWKELRDREIISNISEEILGNNKVQTSKYTCVNFLPRNLLEQFSKTANIYFLVNFFNLDNRNHADDQFYFNH